MSTTKVSMFGLVNSKELMLRARTAGVPVEDTFFDAMLWAPIQECALALELHYGLTVVGGPVYSACRAHPVPLPSVCRVRSTVQPLAVFTIANPSEPMINDLLRSGLYEVI